MDHTIDTSVIICIYTDKRWNDICEAILSIDAQQGSRQEVIVVCDHNPALFERARQHFTNTTVVPNEGARGLSAARNTGIKVARGTYIAFLDDDAVANPSWLANMTRHFENPTIIGVTSLVIPAFIGSRPRWFPDELFWIVGCSHVEARAAAGPVRNGSGGAMCVRASAMAKAGGFNTQLGRDGSALPISCEETEWCLRATRMTNGIFMFDPDAVIHHKVPTSRLTWSYLVVRCFAEGVSKARLSRLIPSTGALGNEKRYVWQAFTQTAGRELRAAGHGDLPALGRLMALWLGIGCAAAGYMGSTLLTAAKTAISSQFGLKKTPPISTTANGSEPLKTVAGYDAKPHNL